MPSAAASGSGAAAFRKRQPQSSAGPAGTRRLGDALIAQGVINAEQLDWALEAHHRTGERLGRILLSAGLVDRRTVYRTLAKAWELPFYDLHESPADQEVAELFPRELLVQEGWMPLTVLDRALIVATCEEPSLERGRAILWKRPVGWARRVVGEFRRDDRVGHPERGSQGLPRPDPTGGVVPPTGARDGTVCRRAPRPLAAACVAPGRSGVHRRCRSFASGTGPGGCLDPQPRRFSRPSASSS